MLKLPNNPRLGFQGLRFPLRLGTRFQQNFQCPWLVEIQVPDPKHLAESTAAQPGLDAESLADDATRQQRQGSAVVGTIGNVVGVGNAADWTGLHTAQLRIFTLPEAARRGSRSIGA